MSSKRYTEEFKIEAVKQIKERGYSVQEVANHFRTTTHSLYAWLKKYGNGPAEPLQLTSNRLKFSDCAMS